MSDNPFVSHPDFAQPQVPVNPLTTPPPVGLVEVKPETPAEAAPTQRTADNQPAPSEESIAAKKYGDDIAAVRKGYDEQFAETQRILAEERALKEQNQLLLQRLMQTMPQAPIGKSPEEELTELGIPAATVEKFVDKLVQARLEPLARMAAAQAEIAGEIPDFQKVAPELQRFMRSNPTLSQEYEEMVRVNPKVATKYIWREYQAQQPQPRVSAADTGLNRTNASIPTNNSMGARVSGERDFQAELEAARNHFQQTGDERPYWKIWAEYTGGGNPMHPAFQTS